MKSGYWAAAAALLLVVQAGALEMGEQAEKVVFKDIRYLPRTLDDLGAKPAVLYFHTGADAGALDTLDAMAESEELANAVVAGLDVDPARNILDLSAETLARDDDYIVLKDMECKAAKALGVTQVPAAVVLDKDHKLAYRGSLAGAKAAALALLSGAAAPASEAVSGTPLPDWSVPVPAQPPVFKDVAGIVYQHCTPCHRPGETAPFSLRTYKQMAANAEMMAEVVREGRMPPWYGAADHGTFMNDRRMSDSEIQTILQWVAADTPKGDLKDAPEPPEYPESEWRIGEPDLILEVPGEFETPATGYVDYQYEMLPYQFPEETWVQGIEILPSNAAVVHHANLAYNNPEQGGYAEKFNFLTGYVPGGAAADIPAPVAMRIPKDSGLFLQIHYVTTGKKEKNKMRVGIRYAEGTVLKQVHYKRLRPETIDITPYDPRFQMSSEWSFDRNAIVLALFSHMHVRGRDMSFFAKLPDGKEETLLRIPNYSFDWQLAYSYVPGAKLFPKGTTLKTVSHYDNSAFNPYNPDPSDRVQYGDQTVNEMNDAYVFFLDQDEFLNIQVDGETGRAAANPEVASAR
ncbi:MAG: redoxin domain-containing protein [Candidatus Hydrogenedens sp.]|nr:redoxin domain-containing protein [Candidatus Hydrogenedens sp.]